MSDKKCECSLCKISIQIRTLEAKMPKELLQEYLDLINVLYNRMAEAETDLEHLELQLTGCWPNKVDGKYYHIMHYCMRGKRYEVKGIPVDE